MSLALLILTGLLADTHAPTTTYYLGETQVKTGDGKPLGNMVSLVKREVIPADSKIIETVLMVSSYPGEPTKEFVAVFSVKGETFTMKEQSGAFAGDGELIGKPWAWTAWNSTSKVAGERGVTVVSRDKLNDRGMAVIKDVFSPDGTPRAKLVEDYATIDGATYALLRSKLAPKEILQPKAPK